MYRQYYFESLPCRINLFTPACSFPACCLSAFNNYLDHSLIVIHAGVQSDAQMPVLSIWAVSKALRVFILSLFLSFSICPHTNRGSGRPSICIACLLIRHVKRMKVWGLSLHSWQTDIYLFNVTWKWFLEVNLMKNVKKCPAIFHIPDLQLAKTYSSVQDFLIFFFTILSIIFQIKIKTFFFYMI